MLNKSNDLYLDVWEIDFTSREKREKYAHLLDREYQDGLERKVSKYIQDNFSFTVFAVEKKQERLELESKLISTVSLCKECSSSSDWLGLHSPKDRIRESGLWQVNELYKEPLGLPDMDLFQ